MKPTTAVISSNFDHTYLFFLPITAWCWHKLGVKTKCFMAGAEHQYIVYKPFIELIQKTASYGSDFRRINLFCEEGKSATYAQCARLYAGALKFEIQNDDEIVITADSDMLVFSRYILEEDEQIHVFGHDLVPPGQLPICYLSMPKWRWNLVMRCEGKKVQEILDYHLGSIETENFRGNYWARDQELAFSHIMPHDHVMHSRARQGTQFATRRYDRDDMFMLDKLNPNTIDFHMPRPGYESDNFLKIYQVLKFHYPDESLDWFLDYTIKYKKLLQADGRI